MNKVFLLLATLAIAGCAEIKSKPTLFIEVTISEITDCHTFHIAINGKKEEWIGCKLNLKTNRGVEMGKDIKARELEFTYFYLGEKNPYQVGQKVVISLENEESKTILSITPKN